MESDRYVVGFRSCALLFGSGCFQCLGGVNDLSSYIMYSTIFLSCICIFTLQSLLDSYRHCGQPSVWPAQFLPRYQIAPRSYPTMCTYQYSQLVWLEDVAVPLGSCSVSGNRSMEPRVRVGLQRQLIHRWFSIWIGSNRVLNRNIVRIPNSRELQFASVDPSRVVGIRQLAHRLQRTEILGNSSS